MAMESLDLAELNLKAAGLGSWVRKVHGMRSIHYEYTWQGKPQKGHKLECVLMAADGSYCMGMMRSLHPKAAGGVGPAAELKKMMGKYFNGSIWVVSKVTLSKEKTEYIGAPHKVCIDLRKTKTHPVLQSMWKKAKRRLCYRKT